ncbi:MAG: hypothetical protein JWO05_3514 [Gemmatimonadetes bacterium]|nr:hypothetical protein [Gemmatimonadota bacterium]
MRPIMSVISRPAPGVRFVRALACVLLTIASVTCTDNTPTSAVGLRKGMARLAIAPSFERMPEGAPTIELSKVRGVLARLGGDSVYTEAVFDGDSAILVFELRVTGEENTFQLVLTAYDRDGEVAYQSSDNVKITPGENPPVAPKPMVYAGVDAAVIKLTVAPTSIQLDAGKSGPLAVTGTNSTNQPISPLHVGWTSRNPAIASVNDAGIVTAGNIQGQTYVVARTATNIADSALVRVKASVAQVVLTPSAASVARGDSVQLAAVLKDVVGNTITDRTATFAAADATALRVTAGGWAVGLKNGAAVVTATSEGKSASATITVGTPISRIDVSPAPFTLASLGEVKTASAAIVAKGAASTVAGLSVTWKSENPAIATVDSKGVVTAIANGTTNLVASSDGVDGKAVLTVAQVATTVTVSPKTDGVNSAGDRRKFSASAKDARGNAIVSPAVTWRSSDERVASVDADGTVTARGDGRATITASVNGVEDSGTFSVIRVPVGVTVTATPTEMDVGDLVNATAQLVDAAGQPIVTTDLVITTLDPARLQSLGGGAFRATAPGSARIRASSGTLTAEVTVSVRGAVVSSMALNLATAEKLPNGTQTFKVVSGGGPAYIWSVNGVDNGNSTFGRITFQFGDSAVYQAPAAVPTPDNFQLCARRLVAPTEQGCATVTIRPVPSVGGEVVVFNDENMFDNFYGANHSQNTPFYQNLVNYTAAGARASQTGVMMHRGHNSICGTSECSASAQSLFRAAITGAGYTITDVDAQSGSVGDIPSGIKVLFLWMPVTPYSPHEINILKSFAAEGGRIIFIGEHSGYYGSNGVATENAFFSSMGAQMTNAGGAFDCGQAIAPAGRIFPHQITTGVVNLAYACASEVIPGPNDYVLLRSLDGTHVLGAVAKVDLTPISEPATSRMSRSVVGPAFTPAPGVTGAIAVPPRQ